MNFRLVFFILGLTILVLLSTITLPFLAEPNLDHKLILKPSQPSIINQIPSIYNMTSSPTPISPWYTLKTYISQKLSLKSIPSLKTITTNNTYTLGYTRSFWVNNLSANLNNPETAFYQVPATLEAISNFSYIFVANSYISSSTENLANYLASTFNTIYHKEVPFFGTPSDVDNNGKIIVLLYPITGFAGVVGYFDPLDEYQPSSDPTNITHYSNYADLVDINVCSPSGCPTLIYSTTAADTLAHEFKHLIEFHMNPNQDVWLDEGLAVYAEQYTGYGQTLSDYLTSYTTNIDLSMTYWQYDTNGLAHYGAAFLFLLYLSDRFTPGLISNISRDGQHSGLDAINFALKNYNSSLTVEGVFQDFIVALAINNLNKSPQYRFLNYTGKASILTSWDLNNPSNLIGRSIQHWAGEIIQLTSSSTTQNFWLVIRNESAPWMGFQRDLHLKLVRFNSNSNSWEVTSLNNSLPTLYTVNNTYSKNYLIIISTTGNSSGYNPANNPITWITNYNLFSQPAISSLPLIRFTDISSSSIQVNIYMPLDLTTNSLWTDPTKATVTLDLKNSTNYANIASYNNFSWDPSSLSYSIIINTTSFPLGDYFFQGVITSGSQSVNLFSVGLIAGVNNHTSTGTIGVSLIVVIISLSFLAFGKVFILRKKKKLR